MSHTSEVERRPPCAFDTKVALACEVARLLCQGRYARLTLWDGRIEELAWEAGERAGLEGGTLASPLIDLAEAGCKGIRRIYELSFWSHSRSLNPLDYFDVSIEGPWIRIVSRQVAGGDGEVLLHRSFVDNFFARAGDWNVTPYATWALDPYPVGGATVLYRYQRIDHEHGDVHDLEGEDALVCRWASSPHEGMLEIDPDTHPSTGSLVFGEPQQELEQQGALCRLRSTVRHLIAEGMPSAEDRAKAAALAAEISRRVSICFMPSSGYCAWCEADVTPALSQHTAEAAITGCPCCSHTWCE